jgi:hypothetical protein
MKYILINQKSNVSTAKGVLLDPLGAKINLVALGDKK